MNKVSLKAMEEVKNLFKRVLNKYAPVSPEILEIIFPLFDIYTTEKGHEIIS